MYGKMYKMSKSIKYFDEYNEVNIPLTLHAFFNKEGFDHYKGHYSIFSQPNGNLIFVTSTVMSPVFYKNKPQPGEYVGVVKMMSLATTNNIKTHPYLQITKLFNELTNKNECKFLQEAMINYQQFNPLYNFLNT